MLVTFILENVPGTVVRGADCSGIVQNPPEPDSKPSGEKQLRTSTDEEREMKGRKSFGGCLCVVLFKTFSESSREREAGRQIKEALKAELKSLVLILPGRSVSDRVTGSGLGNHAWVALFCALLWR